MTDYEQYDALIFDMDGTLLDSMHGHYRAWQQTACDFGFKVEPEWYFPRGGSPTIVTAKALVSELGLQLEPEVLANHKTELFAERVHEYLTVLPFADVARHYAGKKPQAIGTGMRTVLAERMLDISGLLPLFDVVVGAEQVANHKPSPDTFLHCAALLGVEPSRCLVFEDAEFGIAAAKAAGMDVVDVRVADVGLD